MDPKIKEALDAMHVAWNEFLVNTKKNNAEAAEKAKTDYLALKAMVDELTASNQALTADLKELMISGIGAGNGPRPKSERDKAFDKYLRTTQTHNYTAVMNAALVTGEDANGGYLVPEYIEQGILKLSATLNPLWNICRVVNVSTNNFNKRVQLTGVGGGWVGESDARTQTNAPTYGNINIPVHEEYANPFASEQMVEDAAYDVGNEMSVEAAKTFAGMELSAFTNGDGDKKPVGFMTATAVADASWAWGKVGQIETASTSFTNVDELRTTIDALKAPYRATAKWMGRRSTLSTLLNLKAGTSGANLYLLYQPSFVPGQPDKLMGYDFVENDDMPAVAAGAIPLAFAAWGEAYLIVNRVGTRLTIDPYSSKPMIEFYFRKRIGGGIFNYEAIKFLKVKTA